MKFPTPIPEKVFINLLYELLELSAMSQNAKLEALKSYSKDSGLLFTFDKALRGMPVDIPISDTYDETGEFKSARNKYIQLIFKPKNFTLNDFSIGKEKAFACIRQFEVSGVGFNIINKDKSNLGSYDVDLAKAYVKKSDFINFINLVDESGDNALKTTGQNLGQPIQKSVKPTSKAGYTQNQRFVEFEKYCKQRAKEKKLPDEEHQTIYDSFTPPLTKIDFYKELSKYDMKIFNGNIRDFFGDKRVKIEFSKAARKI